MRVSYRDGTFICRSSFAEREIPKRAGFRWDDAAKIWFTTDLRAAGRLREFCDEEAKEKISRLLITKSPWTAGLSYPLDEKPRPFQKIAAIWALSRNRSYIAAEMGLGKTPIAAVVISSMMKFLGPFNFHVLFISPPHLVLNAAEEFKRWCRHWRAFEVVAGVPMLEPLKFQNKIIETALVAPAPRFKYGGVWIIPDSLLHRKDLLEEVRDFSEVKNKILLVDEAHRFKENSAKRTQALFRGVVPHFFQKTVFLSGTPMPNRPIELYPVLSHLAPETIDFENEFKYALKYCAAYQDDYGWNYSGASNTDELGRRVRANFMLRMLKKDVMKDLPEKIEELVFIGRNLPPKLAAIEKKILAEYSPEDLMAAELTSAPLATYRRLLGELKVKESIDFILGELEKNDESFLIFAIHKETISLLKKALAKFSPLVITGDTPMPDRHEIVKKFQAGTTRVFIGNIKAAGTGITLTRASRVVFVEFGWPPGDNDQAADRAHRIGQKSTVVVQYLVYANSIDRKVLERVIAKREVIADI